MSEPSSGDRKPTQSAAKRKWSQRRIKKHKQPREESEEKETHQDDVEHLEPVLRPRT